jgi:hypothetical protein
MTTNLNQSISIQARVSSFFLLPRSRIKEVLELDTVVKKIGKSEWWMVVIG